MKYYYLLTNKSIIFEKEPIEEIFRERVNYYIYNKKTIDFWILNSIKTIKNKIFSKELKNLNNTEKYIFIISTNKNFIEWLNLRFKNSIKFYKEIKNTTPFGKENQLKISS